jgi:CheY-like chemotaxis protein
MSEGQYSAQQQSLVAWLGESEKLHVFFGRVLAEAQEQRVDRIQFTIDGEALQGSLRRAGTELKSLTVKAAWFEPMARWLFDRCAYAWSKESSLGVRFPQDQMESSFPVLLKAQNDYVRALVSQRLVLNRKHVLTLSELEFRTCEQVFQGLDLLPEQVRELQSSIQGETGIFVVGGPDDIQTQRARATYLSLLGAHAAGSAEEVLAFPALKELLRERHLVVTRTASDAWTLARSYISEPYAELVRAVILTGFVPRVCPYCKRQAAIPGTLLSELPEGLARRLGRYYSLGSGCAECNQAGTLGLCGIVSMQLFDPSRRAALKDAEGLRLLHRAQVLPLLEDGVNKVEAGKITLSQLFALTKSVPAAFLPLLNQHRQETTRSEAEASRIALSADVFEGGRGTPQVLSGRAAFTGSKSDAGIDGPLFSLGSSGKLREKPMVLVVEDDPDQRSILEVLLRSSGYEIISAGNGCEALDLLARELPDLMVTDLMMPKMDGAELISRVRADARTRKLPILVLTVLSDSEKEYALLDVGADDYCEKTIQRKVLLKRIEKLVQRRLG